jgi:hypothetical protein
MAISLSFPEEVPQYCCRLLFRKYVRPRPNQPINSTFGGVIRLPLPTNLVDNFSIEVSSPKLDILGNAPSDVMMAGKAKMEQYAQELRSGKGALAFIKDAALEAAAIMPGISDSAGGASSKIGQLAQLQTGMVRNPHLTTIFDGVRLKSYNFTWKLSPRSETEANNLEEIIKNIKAFMHPALIGGGFALEYPYLTELTFSVGDNNILPNVKTSFITAMTINGAGGGTPAFYKDGKSVIVELGLAFQEINVQTRDDFIKNFNQTAG